MVVSVLPTTATALSTPVVPDAPLTAVWIVSTSLLRFVDNWLSEVWACCPAAVSGLPRPFRSASVWVAVLASFAALVMPAFDGLLVTELAAVVIDPFHVVIAEQTPVAHVSVADAPLAVVVVVAVVVDAAVVVLLLEERSRQRSPRSARRPQRSLSASHAPGPNAQVTHLNPP